MCCSVLFLLLLLTNETDDSDFLNFLFVEFPFFEDRADDNGSCRESAEPRITLMIAS